MTEAKPPDNERDWDSIDIFLFTNGQQYSPPRKYHLRADELNFWDATLCHLARSQFGSMHPSMRLHTLNGQQVQGPMELSNGGAYVAVEPPDAFIDTGYDKYLIKASRSWEKRQARKSSMELTPDATPLNDEDPKTNVIASEVISNVTPMENSTEESVINRPMKPPNVSKIQKRSPKPSPTTKQVDRKRTSTTERVTTFKKVANPVPIVTAANKLANKTSPPKKLTKSPIRTSNTPQANISAKSRIHTKTVYKAKENIPTGPLKEDRKSTSLTRITSDVKIMSTDNTPVENFIGDKNLILVSNLYQNPKNNTNKSKIIYTTVKNEQADLKYSPEIITIDEETQSVIDQTTKTPQGRVSIQKEDVRNSKITIVNITNDSKNAVDDNNVTFMNKGDVVNLRLMIEVRNVDNRNEKYKIVCISQSGTNILRPQKDSQINIEDEVFIQSKSLQSVLENEYCQGMHADSDPKVVVVRCGCRQYDNENDMTNVNTSSMYTYKRYFILLPKWEDNADRCKCDENTKQNTDKNEQKQQESKRSSTVTPVKQTSSHILLDRIMEPKNTEHKSRSSDMEAPIYKKKSNPSQADYSPNVGNGANSEYGIESENTDNKPRSADIEAPISKKKHIPPQADYSANVDNSTYLGYGIESKNTENKPRSTDIEVPISKKNHIPPQADYSPNFDNSTNSGYVIESKNTENKLRSAVKEAPTSKKSYVPGQANYSTNVGNGTNSGYGIESENTEKKPTNADKEAPISKKNYIPPQANYSPNVDNGVNSEYGIDSKNTENKPRSADIEAPLSKKNDIPPQANYSPNVGNSTNSEYGNESNNTENNPKSADIEAPVSKKNYNAPQANYSPNVDNGTNPEYGIESNHTENKPKITNVEAPIPKNNSILPQADCCSNVSNGTNSEYDIESSNTEHKQRSTDEEAPISKKNYIPPQTDCCSNGGNGTNSEYGNESRNSDIETPVSNHNYIPHRTDYNTNIGNRTNSEYGTNKGRAFNAKCATDEYVVPKHNEVVTDGQIPESDVTTGQCSSVVPERTEYIDKRKSSLKEPRTEYIVRTKSSPNEPKTYVDNSTQTDNSDILLEARRHEDGRYTFHLPSLYTLKLYHL